MKKIFAVLLIAATLLSLLSGCGEEKLEPIEKAQARAVEIGRQYLDYKITAAEAKEMLDSIKVPETEGNGQLYLDCDIDFLSFIIGQQGSSYEEIKEQVDSIEKFDYTK